MINERKIVNKIKRLMKQKKVGQVLLADELTKRTNKNYSQSTVSKMLKDDSSISVYEKNEIFRILSRYPDVRKI